MPAMVIDCDSCRAAGPACHDCMVSVLLGPPQAVREVAEEHRPALEVLAGAGLVPPLRLVTDAASQAS